jgi:hypothetical protein
MFEGVKEIPAAMGTYYNPGFQSPGTTYCSGSGGLISCNTAGGINVAPTVASYDANTGLRLEYVARCMTRRGYSLRKTPFCGSSTDTTSQDCQIPDY